jgi:hypothetical protein
MDGRASIAIAVGPQTYRGTLEGVIGTWAREHDADGVMVALVVRCDDGARRRFYITVGSAAEWKRMTEERSPRLTAAVVEEVG